jgi:TPR repeat protein
MYYLSAEGNGLRDPAEAVRWLTRAAEQNDTQAQQSLASIYLAGFQKERLDQGLFAETVTSHADFSTALQWALRGAEAGSVSCQALAGYIYTMAPGALRDTAKAEHWYSKAAAQGSPQAHLGLGIGLLQNATTDEPTFAGVEHIRTAAEADLPDAHYYLAAIYERGIGVLPDLERAASHYGKAANGGVNNARAKYGLMLLRGIGIKQNKVEGETWLRRAALAGDGEAAFIVADIYAKGEDGLPPAYTEAAQWFRMAAEAGNKAAARALAILHLTGAGTPRDADEAAKWFRLAAEAGDPIAQADLAELMRRGATNPRFTEPAPVQDWFEQAAEAGDAVAAYNFAVCLAEGVNLDKDEARAALWFRKAADTVMDAALAYGIMLEQGRGIERDTVAAREWVGKAATAKLPRALLEYGRMLIQGIGGPRDDEAARAAFELAAEAGVTHAMFALGALHGGGHEIPTDRAASLRWYEKAAQAGHAGAALMLGKYLRHGIATPADPAAARAWLSVAAKAGVPGATEELAALQAPPEAAA